MKEETKETISSIVFAIAEGSRRNMINTILEYSGDEYETKDDMEELAKETDEQLKFRLKDLVEYYLNEEE